MIRTATLVVLSLALHTSNAISVGEMSVQNSACSAPTGAIDIYVSGGSPPYSYAWSNGATTEDISDLAPGTYSVTVTDANSDQAVGGWTITTTQLTSPSSAQDGHASCVGSSGGEVQVIEWGINGLPPYSYSPMPSGVDPQGDPFFYFPSSPPGTEVQITVTDANGCSGTLFETVTSPQLFGGPNMAVSDIHGSCSGGNGGSATVTNINDGFFFQSPEYALLDALDQGVEFGYNAPNSITFTGLAPGDYHFVRDWDATDTYMAFPCDGNPFDRIDFTIPDLGPECGSVSGLVFIDNDQDCTQDGGEVGVPFQVLEIQPGPGYAITGSDGQYAFDVQDGSYTLAQTDPTLVQLCPVTGPVPFSIASDQTVIDLADSSTVSLDLKAELGSGPMRPGFMGTFWGLVRNLSPQLSGTVSVTMDVDDALVYLAAEPTPTSVTGNMILWELPAFTALQQMAFSVSVEVPVGTPIGTPISTSLFVSNSLPEDGSGNNLAILNDLVTGSFDPNVKTARTSSGYSDEVYYIGEDHSIDYTIRFQNTGTDTAFTVVITDTLSEVLDMASFQQGMASHPFQVAFKPGRVVEWTFANILLPDSGTDEVASHGLVSFRIRPALPLVAGTLIVNGANIYFDLNEPVITDPNVLTAEMSTDVIAASKPNSLLVFPNPASTVLTIMLPVKTDLLRVIASDGRMVLTRVGAQGRVDIPVEGLPSGAYSVEVTTVGGEVLRARFIKQ